MDKTSLKTTLTQIAVAGGLVATLALTGCATQREFVRNLKDIGLPTEYWQNEKSSGYQDRNYNPTSPSGKTRHELFITL